MKKTTLILTITATIVFSSSSVFSKTTMEIYNTVADISSEKSCGRKFFESIEAMSERNIAVKQDECKMQPSFIIFKGLRYNFVVSPDTGRVWLDRNLGASRVCISSTDSECVGHFYQWGRGADGHELPTSSITTTKSPTLTPTHGHLIDRQVLGVFGDDWAVATLDPTGNLRAEAWGGNSSILDNDICPAGFSVPTEEELQADTVHEHYGYSPSTVSDTNDITNTATAFDSFLKIAVTGYRAGQWGGDHLNDPLIVWWTRSHKASRDVDGTYKTITRSFLAGSNFAVMQDSHFIDAYPVRCIKD